MRRITVAAHITLYAVVFTVIHVYIGISSFHTLYPGFHYDTYIDISLYHTLCSVFHYDTRVYRYQPISHLNVVCITFHAGSSL